MTPGRRMPLLRVLVALAVAIIISATPIYHSKRAKRIAFGRDLTSNSIFNTQYFVELRENFNCLIDHDKHEFLASNCQSRHLCGASLIHPQFVMTAAHCLFYVEYIIKEITPRPPPPEIPQDTRNIFRKIYDWIRGVKWVPIVPKQKHTVHTDYALLAGATNVQAMTQMRHTHYLFLHPSLFEMIEYNKKNEVNRTITTHAHDFIIVQACEPFEIDKNVKLAGLDSQPVMEAHYKRVVNEGLVCLYIGLGFLDEDEWVQFTRAPYDVPHSNWTQYTWRPSVCSSGCNEDSKEDDSLLQYVHTCQLCSENQGPLLNTFLRGDSGSPVICDGKLTAIASFGVWQPRRNATNYGSYAVHCSRNLITLSRLKHYLTLKPDPFHPLSPNRKHKLLN